MSIDPGPRRKPLTATLAIALLLSVALGVSAQESDAKTRRQFDASALTSKWRVEVGGSLSSFDTNAAYSPAGLGGAVVILESTLGLDEEITNLFLNAGYRFNRRHSIELEYTDLGRDAIRIIDEEIDWGDYVFRASGTVESKLDTKIFRLRWKYDFSDSGRLNAGFSAGLSTFNLGLELRGEARLEDDEGGEWVEGAVEGVDLIAPVPVIGFYLDYALSPRWILSFNAEFIDLDVGGKAGRVVLSRFNFQHSFTELFSLGLGIGGIDIEYSAEKEGDRFGVEYRITSFDAFLAFTF
jgi:hypothetical protein